MRIFRYLAVAIMLALGAVGSAIAQEPTTQEQTQTYPGDIPQLLKAIADAKETAVVLEGENLQAFNSIMALNFGSRGVPPSNTAYIVTLDPRNWEGEKLANSAKSMLSVYAFDANGKVVVSGKFNVMILHKAFTAIFTGV